MKIIELQSDWLTKKQTTMTDKQLLYPLHMHMPIGVKTEETMG